MIAVEGGIFGTVTDSATLVARLLKCKDQELP
jgi:hypothetical protein